MKRVATAGLAALLVAGCSPLDVAKPNPFGQVFGWGSTVKWVDGSTLSCSAPTPGDGATALITCTFRYGGDGVLQPHSGIVPSEGSRQRKVLEANMPTGPILPGAEVSWTSLVIADRPGDLSAHVMIADRYTPVLFG